MNNIVSLTANELVGKLKSGEISCVEVCKAFIERVDKFEKEVKAWAYIDKKNIKTTDTLNSNLLKKLKLIDQNSIKLKILGSGAIKDKINIEADLASKSAVEKLEKIGGSIQLKK